MRYTPIVVLCICVSVSAQVTGDKSKKVFWSNDCAERMLVPLRDAVNFTSASEAESYGLKKAESCTDPSKAAMVGRFNPPPVAGVTRESRKKWSLVLSNASGDLFPGVSDPRNLLDLSTSWLRYQRKRLRVNGTLTASTIDPNDFSSPLTQYVSFLLNDGTDSIYLIMRNGGDAERLRKYLVQKDSAIILASVFTLGKTTETAQEVAELTLFQIFEKSESDEQ